MTSGLSKLVYIETSLVSYLTARPTSDLLAAAWQKTTADWWDTYRSAYNVCTSPLTIEEAGRGDPGAAARRLEALSDIDVLPITDTAIELASSLIREGTLPLGAENDALHIGIAAVHGVDFLLTWNFRHLANAQARPAIRSLCTQQGFASPEICTPSELIGGLEHER